MLDTSFRKVENTLNNTRVAIDIYNYQAINCICNNRGSDGMRDSRDAQDSYNILNYTKFSKKKITCVMITYQKLHHGFS